MITKQEFERANRRGAELRAKGPVVRAVEFDCELGRVVIHFQSNIDLTFLPEDVQGLENGTPAELSEIELSPSGLGLHFPKLDADVYIPSLLEGITGTRKWMASRLGVEGGKSRSPEKRNASRENGKLGGRPRKLA